MVKEFRHGFLHVYSEVEACLFIIKAIYDGDREFVWMSRRDCIPIASLAFKSGWKLVEMHKKRGNDVTLKQFYTTLNLALIKIKC